MRKLSPTQPTDHDTTRISHVLLALDGAEHVYIRGDAKALPLTRPYTGPFKVIHAHAKYFELEMNGKTDRVLIDRLKKAYIAKEVHCYDLNSQSATSAESREQELPLEELPSIPTQPFKQRGRPIRAVAEEKREKERDAERRREREQEHEKAKYDREFPHEFQYDRAV